MIAGETFRMGPDYLATSHNCGACFYDCQFSPPHEFNVNVPKAMSERVPSPIRHTATHFLWLICPKRAGDQCYCRVKRRGFIADLPRGTTQPFFMALTPDQVPLQTYAP